MPTIVPDDIREDEQYADILEILRRLLPLLEDQELDNHQPLGRLKGSLLFLKQEVDAKKFPIPGTRDMVSTIAYLAGNPMFPEGFPDISQDLYDIVTLVTCMGLIKYRHYPKLLELVCELITGIDELLKGEIELTKTEEAHFLDFHDEMQLLAKKLHHRSIKLPLSKMKWRTYWDKSARSRVWDISDQYYKLERALNGPLTSRWRPRQSQPTPGWEMPDWVKEPL